MATLDAADLTASDVLAAIRLYRCLGVAVPSAKVYERSARYAVVEIQTPVMSPSDRPHG